MTVQESDRVRIVLTSDMIAFCDKWAHRRQANAEADDLAAHNNAPTEHGAALNLHVIGLRGECPGYLYLKPIKWSVFADTSAVRNQLADLEDWIDVKARTEGWHDLMVQRNDPSHWAYVLVLAHEHPRYCLVGWCWGHEAQQEKYWSDPAGNRPAYFVRQDDPILKPMADLLAEVRRRQAPPKDHFLHTCAVCGADYAPFGYGVNLRADKPGTWYCREHRPTGGNNG